MNNNITYTLIFSLFLSLRAYAQKDYTLEISNLHIKEKNNKNITLTFDLSNSGNADIELPYATPFSTIEIVYEASDDAKKLIAYRYLIEEKLAKENIILPSGAVKSNLLMRFSIQKKEIYREKVNIPIATDTITTQKSVTIDNAITTTLLSTDSVEIGKIILPTQNIDTETCADLRIDSIWLLKLKGKYVTLRFSIKNIGNQAVKLWGDTPRIEDNLAVRAYLASLNHYTKSALPLRGLYIQDEAEAIGGLLDAQQSILVDMELNLKDKTKFTPFILLEINALQTIIECNMEQNISYLKLNQ